MKREFKHIRKDFNSYDDMNAFCMNCRCYPRGMSTAIQNTTFILMANTAVAAICFMTIIALLCRY